jgi:hypothetical protein
MIHGSWLGPDRKVTRYYGPPSLAESTGGLNA